MKSNRIGVVRYLLIVLVLADYRGRISVSP